MASGKISIPTAMLVVLFYGAAILKVTESIPEENSKFVWIQNVHFNKLLAGKGENMCASEEVNGKHRRTYYSECTSHAPYKVCGKETKIKFHCCSGFDRENDNAHGCKIVKPVVNLNETLLERHLYNFHNLWKEVDPELKLLIAQDSERIGTLFVPNYFDNKTLPADVKELLKGGNTKDNLLYHQMVKSRYTTPELVAAGIVPSMYKDNAPIKILKYNGGITTANCVRIVLPNQMATNGIIHITEKFIKPLKKTVWEILTSIPIVSKFKDYLAKVKLDVLLQQPGKCFTVFAPTNEAFEKMDADIKKLIDSDDVLLKRLLLFHITDCCFCSASVLSSVRPRSLEGERLSLSCNVDDHFLVNHALAIQTDHAAENGVVHVIDKVLIPDSVKTLKAKLEQQSLTEFLELVKEAGMMEMLTSRKNYTIFAPTNEVIKRYKLQLKGDKELLKAFVSNHIVSGYFPISLMIGMEYLDTVNTNSNFSSHLFANVYHSRFGVNNAMLLKSEYLVGNGVLHVIDEALMPARESLAARMSSDSSLSIFWSMVEELGLNFSLAGSEEQWTVFAPVDGAMGGVRRWNSWDREKLLKFVMKHVVKRAVFPVGLLTENTNTAVFTHRYYSEGKAKLDIKGDTGSSVLRINNNAKITRSDCDLSNGVLYTINRIIE